MRLVVLAVVLCGMIGCATHRADQSRQLNTPRPEIQQGDMLEQTKPVPPPAFPSRPAEAEPLKTAAHFNPKSKIGNPE